MNTLQFTLQKASSLDNSLFTLYTAGRPGSWRPGCDTEEPWMEAEPTLPFLGSTARTLSLSSLCTSGASPVKYQSWLRTEISGDPLRSPPTPTLWFCCHLPTPSADHPPLLMKSHPNYLMSTYWLTNQLEQTARTQQDCTWCCVPGCGVPALGGVGGRNQCSFFP